LFKLNQIYIKTNFGGNIGKENIWHKILKQIFEKIENIRVEQKL